MRKLLVVIALMAAPAALSGCATSATVAEAPLTAGVSQDFAAPYEVAKAAALEAVERLNVDIQGSDETPERFQVRFSKPISGFSWGEVGTVNVIRGDEQHTRIYVHSEKRSRAQITGTSERQFAEQIFANITESLARLQQ